MNHRLGQREKLKSKILISTVFSEGKTSKKYPLVLRFKPIASTHHKAGFSASKRNFRKAVDRNKLKRLMREAYRRKKAILDHGLTSSYALMFIYVSREEIPFSRISIAMEDLLCDLARKEKRDRTTNCVSRK